MPRYNPHYWRERLFSLHSDPVFRYFTGLDAQIRLCAIMSSQILVILAKPLFRDGWNNTRAAKATCLITSIIVTSLTCLSASLTASELPPAHYSKFLYFFKPREVTDGNLKANFEWILRLVNSSPSNQNFPTLS